MKKILTAVFTVTLIFTFFMVLYNFIDKRNTYERVFAHHYALNDQYFKLQKIIDDYTKKLNDDELKEDDFIDVIATDEKEIEIISSDIDKILKNISNKDSQDNSKKAYLTFDDGPSRITSKILDVLNEYGVKATFFVNGKEDDYSKSLYKRIIDEGNSIGNHTYAHSYKNVYDSVSDFISDFNRLQNIVKEVTGLTMNIMRFPGGSNNTISNHYCRGIMSELTEYYKQKGFQYFDWNVSAGDSRSRRASVRTITNNVLKGARGKNIIIILMHDSKNKKNTLAALPNIIKSLKAQGFELLPLTSSSPNVQFK